MTPHDHYQQHLRGKHLIEKLHKEGAYNQAKHIWLSEHPNATPQEYEAACKLIADTLGVDNGNG